MSPVDSNNKGLILDFCREKKYIYIKKSLTAAVRVKYAAEYYFLQAGTFLIFRGKKISSVFEVNL